MKKITIPIAIILIIILSVITVLMDQKEKAVDLSLEAALLIAENSECTYYNEPTGTGTFDDYYWLWYLDMGSEQGANGQWFTYSCIVDIYNQTARFVVEGEGYNWYESDFE